MSSIPESPENLDNTNNYDSDISFDSEISFDHFIKRNQEKSTLNLHSSVAQSIGATDSSPDSVEAKISSPDMFFDTLKPEEPKPRIHNWSILRYMYNTINTCFLSNSKYIAY